MMEEVTEGKRTAAELNSEVLEKLESAQNIPTTSGTSGTPSVEGDSSSLQTPSDGALEELIPQLSRRGTITVDSPYFSAEKFIRNILVKAKEQGLKRRNAGVIFRSLVVLGYGSEFTHQNTVGTVATGLLRIKD